MMSSDAADDDVNMAAYLAGELDELEAQRVTRRIAQDEAYAARLDRLADTLVALRDPDAVEPPEGFRERLDAALAEQRPRRRRRVPPAALGAVAAGVAALALLAGTLLGAPGSERMAGVEDAADQEITTASEDAASEQRTTEEPADDGAGAPADVGGLDAGMVLGSSVDDAPTLTERGWADLGNERVPDEALSTCRGQVESAVEGPLVPAGAATTVVEGRRAVAIEVVSAADGSRVFDRVGTVVVDSATCEILDVDPG